LEWLEANSAKVPETKAVEKYQIYNFDFWRFLEEF